jgi:hypothetical protein
MRFLAFSGLVVVAGVAVAVAAHAQRVSPAPAGSAGGRRGPPPALKVVPGSSLCVTAGRVAPVSPTLLNVDIGGMRGVIAGDASTSAQLGFVYRGPSKTEAPLANGVVRRQIGLKLRAKNTCNLVYVMWHVEPTSGVFVSVKSNPGMSTHAQCGANGYINLKPSGGVQPKRLEAGGRHTLRAAIEGRTLRAYADGALAWEGALPVEGDAIVGPSGVRSDNGSFDFDLSVPGGVRAGVPCSPADGPD